MLVCSAVRFPVCSAQDARKVETGPANVPFYQALNGDLSEFYFYADGGWDGNWYAGYNNCWVVKLPPMETRGYKKAYIGSKLGRAKSFPIPQRPWESKPAEGKVFMGLSQSGEFSSRQSYFLIDNQDIPLEPLPKESIKGVGGAQWFWTEVPIEEISPAKPNYLALWSEAELFTEAGKSPVVAGAPRKASGEAEVWIVRDLKGTPPRGGKNAFDMPVGAFAPAMAVKLVPENNLKVVPRALDVREDGGDVIISFSAIGQDIEMAWLEMSYDGFNWSRFGRYYFIPPYSMTTPKKSLPASKFYLRAVAVDSLENIGYSKAITMEKGQFVD